MEEFYQPAERAVVDLAAVFAVVAAGHLLFAGVAVTVVVGVNMSGHRNILRIAVTAQRADIELDTDFLARRFFCHFYSVFMFMTDDGNRLCLAAQFRTAHRAVHHFLIATFS